MLEVIIVCAIYAFLQKLLDRPNVKKIKEARTTEEAVALRKRIKKTRIWFFIIFMVAYLIFGLTILLPQENLMTVTYKLLIGVAFFLVYLRNDGKYADYMGNVSTFTKDEYLKKHKRFALFLRGFEKDDYTKLSRLSYAKNPPQAFSEYSFMAALQKRIPACAIGMTKEADSPIGATRVYVDDATWKYDVKEMILKAEVIYILVNDRASCIWEIEQSKDLLQKVVFIIDEVEKYNKLRALSTGILFPKIPKTANEKSHLALWMENDSLVFGKYDYSPQGYAFLAQLPNG